MKYVIISLVLSFLVNQSVYSQETQYGIRVGAISNDIVHRPAGNDSSVDNLFIEGQIRLSKQWNPQWTGYIDLRAQTATDQAQLTDDTTGLSDLSNQARSFVQLRQAWVRYSGLTRYPNEYLTIGLQRVRSSASIWWDSDIESITWQGDTTTFDWFVGVGHRFESYRGGSDLNDQAKDQTRIFGEFSYDWRAYHALTFRFLHASQSDNAVEIASVNPTSTGVNGDALWVGVGFESDWTSNASLSPWAYRIEFIHQSGEGDNEVEQQLVFDQDIDAFAFDAGVRYDFLDGKYSLGATYTVASGGENENENKTFSQTGLQTNRSRYSGNRLFINRFSEALRADLSNLRHASVFVSSKFSERWQTVFTVGDFRKENSATPIFSNSRPIASVDGRSNVGRSYDLSVAYYPQSPSKVNVNYVRLRAGYFDPGDGLVEQDQDYRLTLETLVRF